MSKKKNPITRLYHKLCETRWFYTFTASCTATIVGISLTFGINGCRESRRVKQEAQESIMQAVNNLHVRADGIDEVLEHMARQDSLYLTVLYCNRHNIEIPDSLAYECVDAIISERYYVTDTSFEKIFRESYQLWQILDDDDLTSKIITSFKMVDDIEQYCQYSQLALSEKLENTDFNESLWGNDDRITANILAHNQRLHYFMGKRYENTKTNLNAAKLLHQTIAEIDSICLALGYGTYKVYKSVDVTASSIESDSTAQH
jgi:hypothetical protein